LMWFWFLMLAWMRKINTRFFGSMFGRNVRGNEDHQQGQHATKMMYVPFVMETSAASRRTP
jgi:hypothetical protein